MIKYAILLRGINVGGHGIVKMKDLRNLFAAVGFDDVRTFIASGNIVGLHHEKDAEILACSIEKKLARLMKTEIAAMVRPAPAIGKMVKKNPFCEKEGEMTWVTFLREKPRVAPKLPLISRKKDIELVRSHGFDYFSISRNVNGRFGFPNVFIEEELDVLATTRSWKSINKFAEFIDHPPEIA